MLVVMHVFCWQKDNWTIQMGCGSFKKVKIPLKVVETKIPTLALEL